MTWEILCGFFTLLSALIALGTVLVKLIRTLTNLESAVRELRDFITRQSGKNEFFYKELIRLDKKLTLLEERLHGGET